MERIYIRDMDIGDYDALVALWAEASLDYKPRGRDSREKIAAELAKGTGRFLLAEADGRIIGSVFATHDGRKGWINRLAVHPAYRRSGVGRTLVEAAEAALAAAGIEIIACLVEAENVGSQRAFKAMGYERCDGLVYFRKRKNANV